jgi:putative ABC transport system permease protein
MLTLFGLVAGLTAAILIFLWVNYELGYDRYHPDNERIYGVMINESVDGVIETNDETPVPLADFLTHDVPGIEVMTRFDNTRALLNNGTKSVQKTGAYADSSYFQVFSPVILSGDRRVPLPGNHSIAISAELANLLFDKGDAIGKTIQVDLKTEYKVTAIFAMFPEHSSFKHYHFILPFHAKARSADDWENYYIKLHHGASTEEVENKIDGKFEEFFGNKNATSLLFALTDWRLHWNFENGKISGGRIVYVIIFAITAIFILLMACVNYINISTARAAKRAREVGVRKMTGASQWSLVRYFMTESIVLYFYRYCNVCVCGMARVTVVQSNSPVSNSSLNITEPNASHSPRRYCAHHRNTGRSLSCTCSYHHYGPRWC